MKKYCSFCGKGYHEVKKLISGPNAYICDECVITCKEIIDEEVLENEEKEEFSLLKPHEIKEKLDEYVIGQDDAKKVLSVAVYNHYKRINTKTDVELQKSNVLMLGPTGSGKTLLAETLARILNVPFTIADATTFTEAGYVGEDVENILTALYNNADHNIEQTERGIVYLDEVDKVARKSDSPSITRDVSGEGVQQALLKLIEGTNANIPPTGGRKHPNQELITINTRKILFICGGAFNNLEAIVKARMGKKLVGFKNYESKKPVNKNINYLKEVRPEDVIKFGLIPEFIGRVPIITSLEELSQEAMVRILTEPKNALVKQFKELFKIDNIELDFSDESLNAIAKIAMIQKTGARGLRSILERVMLDFMYDSPSDENITSIEITRESILKNFPEFEDDIFKDVNIIDEKKVI